MTRIAAVAGTVFLFLIVAVPNAHAWWDGKWHQRRKIQFDASSTGADTKENLTDIPVLIRLHAGNFSFSDAKPDGSDIRFIGADDKSPLKFHIEKFDPKNAIALVWVKVPGISGGSNQNFIWMYYGNPSAPDGQDRGGTYDVNQVAVYHFGEQEGLPKDATSYGNKAVSFSGKLGLPAVVGNGAQFSGAGEQMKIAPSPSLNFSKGFTFSAWVRPEQPGENAGLFSWDDGRQSILIGLEGSQAYCSLRSGGGRTITTPATPVLIAKQWHRLTVTVDPEKKITLYLDGNVAATANFSAAVPAPSSDIIIGASSKGGNDFTGDLDEVRLSNIARTGGWAKVSFQGENPDGMLTSVSEEESGGGSQSLTIELMKVIVRTITLDGWLIIGVLFLLGCASLFVFMQKITMLGQAGKTNRAFAQTFRRTDDPTGLVENENEEEDYTGSPLYRVYQAGCEELKFWMEKKGAASTEGNIVSESAMDAFKAAIEKEAMYESRKLSAGMIVLNISVAGGPFLGLLGTVWGVMNTFASLAVSGEANLAAIAPGVASALACTLAGLLVAIPSLFASSYINGRLKDLSADMNVFIDDFILKLEDKRREAA
ncbi:MAG: DUF2341 domain-containing protein [Nitrospiraceae bacterium]|nr:DUF2341 domain-containing protein [Nitrospiraceae bacterium]